MEQSKIIDTLETYQGPLLEEEPKTEAIQPPSTIKGGTLGVLAIFQARPQRRDGEGTSSKRLVDGLASPVDSTL